MGALRERNWDWRGSKGLPYGWERQTNRKTEMGPHRETLKERKTNGDRDKQRDVERQRHGETLRDKMRN